MKIGKASIKSISHLSFRMDPSLHLSEGLVVRKKLAELPYELTTVAKCSSSVFLGNIFSRIFVKDSQHGVTYLAASDSVLENIETERFLAKRQVAELRKLVLDKDWILVTCSGTLGNVTYTNQEFCNKIATHDLIRIIPNDVKLKKGFLYAFLAGKYGFYQITQSQFGGVVKHTNDREIGNVVVPVLPAEFQKEIDNMIQQAASLREQATHNKRSAVELLESFLSSGVWPSSNIVKSTQVFLSHNRLDSQYQSEVLNRRNDNLDLDQFSIESVAEKIYVGNRGKRYYVKNGIPFLSSSDMMLFNPKRWASQISTRTPALTSLRVQKKDILISRSGTVGNCVFVSSGLEDITVSEHAMRLRIDEKKIAPEYIYAYLNTRQGQRKLANAAYGSVIITLGEDFIGEIQVPKIDKKTYDKIVSYVTSYSECLDQAAKLDTKAIALIEAEIESWSK